MRQCPVTCRGHSRPVVDLKFCETEFSPLLISASKDGKAILRTGNTGDWIGTFVGHSGAVWCCTLDDSGRRAATGSADFSAKLWDVITGQEIANISQEHIVRAVDLSSGDGCHLVTANNKHQIFIYDVESTNSPLTCLQGCEDIVRRCIWTYNNKRILTISDDKKLMLWDIGLDSAHSLVWSLKLEGTPNDVSLLSGEDAMRVVVATGKSAAALFELDTRGNSTQPPRPTATFSLPSALLTANLHPSGQMVICGCENNLLYRLDTTTGHILETCRGHFGPIHCARFSPDGHLYASGSEDGTVKLWQTHLGETYGLWKMGESLNEDNKVDTCSDTIQTQHTITA